MKIIFDNRQGNDEIYYDCLQAILGNTKRNSFVDMGCHKSPHLPRLGFKERTYIDILPQVLDYPEEQQYFIQKDVLDVEKGSYKVDVAFSLDVCEHLTIPNGYKLFEILESISTKQILFTPLGEMWVGTSGHPEEHASGWTPEMIPGYASIVFPDYHKGWGFGAFFFFRCDNLEQEFERVKNELKTKRWAV